jgi:hypothetical protein
MESKLCREYLLVKSGKVREARLDESVRRRYKLSTWRRMLLKNRGTASRRPCVPSGLRFIDQS